MLSLFVVDYNKTIMPLVFQPSKDLFIISLTVVGITDFVAINASNQNPMSLKLQNTHDGYPSPFCSEVLRNESNNSTAPYSPPRSPSIYFHARKDPRNSVPSISPPLHPTSEWISRRCNARKRLGPISENNVGASQRPSSFDTNSMWSPTGYWKSFIISLNRISGFPLRYEER